MLCKSSFNHSILFFVTGITYAMGILISINEKGGLTLSTLCFCTISQRASTCWIWTIIQAIITNYNIYIYCWFQMERKRYTNISIWLLLKQWNLRLLYPVQYRNRLVSGVGWLIVILSTITQKISNYQPEIPNLLLTLQYSGTVDSSSQ